ncbi:hypothetical protein [Phenylobacterium sp.]|uniref:hypothetical protein n=1 Tax=Phenylobacterium sp. TaxID=1871053 RepID=UPI0035B06953
MRYSFYVYRRDPRYRLVIEDGAPWPEGARSEDWDHTRTRDAGDTNPDVRTAVAEAGYSLFVIGLSLDDLPPA